MILWRSGVETLIAIISYSGGLEKVFKNFCKEAGLEAIVFDEHAESPNAEAIILGVEKIASMNI